MKDISLLLIGILVSIFGVVNMAGNISTLHSYHRRNVKEDDVPKYGRIVGIGTLLIGLSLIIGYALPLLSIDIPRTYVMGAISVVGIILILYGQFKYNKGIF